MLVKRQVEETVEVTLPFFAVVDGGHYKDYYAIHQGLSINIFLADHTCFVSAADDAKKIEAAIKGDQITEQDFDFAYQMALDRLTKAVNPQKESV